MIKTVEAKPLKCLKAVYSLTFPGGERRLTVVGAMILTAMVASPVAAAAEWSAERIAALFPVAPEEWTAGNVEMEKFDTVVSEFEEFLAPLDELSDPDLGVSARLRATRVYRSGERTIAVSIDTEDIETAAMVDAVDAASDAEGSDPEELVAVGKELLAAGVTAISHDRYPGISAETDDEGVSAFKIGSAGVVSLECAYSDCDADLDLMLGRMDLDSVAEFVAFDHRR